MEEAQDKRNGRARDVGLLSGLAIYYLLKLSFSEVASAAIGAFLGTLLVFPFTSNRSMRFPKWLGVAVLASILVSFYIFLGGWLEFWLPKPLAHSLLLLMFGFAFYWMPSLEVRKSNNFGLSFSQWMLVCCLVIAIVIAINSLGYLIRILILIVPFASGTTGY